eukprot:EST46425.1 Hypothetical protein SS50377_13509 [Spironucleus salmonicida]
MQQLPQNSLNQLRDQLHLSQLQNSKLVAENKSLRFDSHLNNSLLQTNMTKSYIPEDKKLFNKLFKGVYSVIGDLQVCKLSQQDFQQLKQIQCELQNTMKNEDFSALVEVNTQLLQLQTQFLKKQQIQPMPQINEVQQKEYQKFKQFVEQNKLQPQNTYSDKHLMKQALQSLSSNIQTLYDANKFDRPQINFSVGSSFVVNELSKHLSDLIQTLQKTHMSNKSLQTVETQEDKQLNYLKVQSQQKDMQIQFYQDMFESQKQDLEQVVSYVKNAAESTQENSSIRQSSQIHLIQ